MLILLALAKVSIPKHVDSECTRWHMGSRCACILRATPFDDFLRSNAANGGRDCDEAIQADFFASFRAPAIFAVVDKAQCGVECVRL